MTSLEAELASQRALEARLIARKLFVENLKLLLASKGTMQ